MYVFRVSLLKCPGEDRYREILRLVILFWHGEIDSMSLKEQCGPIAKSGNNALTSDTAEPEYGRQTE